MNSNPASLKLFPSSTCLVTEIVEYLKDKGKHELDHILILLPTQRLCTHFLARLAKERCAFFPPKVMSFESLILSGAKPGIDKAISPEGLQFVIHRILKESDWKHLDPSHDRELRLLLEEMWAHGVEDTGFEKLHTYLQEDIYRNETANDTLQERLVEIESVLQKTLQDLVKLERSTAAQYFSLVASDSSSLIESVLSFEEVILSAYTSMTPSWLKPLTALSQLENVSFWLTKPPTTYHQSPPLAKLVDRVQDLCRGELNVSANKESISHRKATLFEVDTPFQEVVAAIELAESLVKGGVEPSQVGILLTDESLYGPLMFELRQELDPSTNLAMVRPFQSTLLGRWLELSIKALEDQSVQSWIDWISHPMTQQWMGEKHKVDSDFIAWSISNTRATSLFAWLNQEENSELSNDIELFRRDFSVGQLPLNLWFERLNIWLTRCQALEGADESSLSVMAEFQRLVESLAKHQDILMSSSEFFMFIRDYLLKQDVRDIGEPLKGIQVISLSEARYYPFEAVIIVGCNEGTFPRALPKDILLNNFLKRQMGLPGWEVIEAMEDQSFHLLKDRIRHLYMIRCKESLGRLMVRSRFIEKLFADEQINIERTPSSVKTFWQNRALSPTSSCEKNENEGRMVPGFEQSWMRISASSLSKLLHCPYSFILSYLKLSPVEFLEESSPIIEGEWLHKVLEVFFSGSVEGQAIHSWDDVNDADFVSTGLSRLDYLTKLLGPKNIGEKALYFHLKHHAWPEFIGHLNRVFNGHVDSLKQGLKEYQLVDLMPGMSIEVRGLHRQLTGRIDSIDFGEGMTLLTDYKRRTSPSPKETQNGLNPQLAIYAISIRKSSLKGSQTHLLGGYWNIIKGEWQGHAVDDQARDIGVKRGLISKRSTSFEDANAACLNLWKWREQHIIDQGRFYADPSKCGLCQYEDVCRKNDPSYSAQIQEQDFLKKHLEGDK